MLDSYPVHFDGVEVMPWVRWEETRQPVENVYQTEAGTDVVQSVRPCKLSVACKYRCHSAWLSRFAAWAEQDEVSVRAYDAKTAAYATRTMRIRGFRATAVEFSGGVPDTNGVWDVEFNLEEF